MSTIGYGDLKPLTIYANLLVLLQTWCGLLIDCLMIGVFYHKFARPSRLRTRVLFSSHAVVNQLGLKQDTPEQGQFFVFKILNAYKPQFVEAKLRLVLLQWQDERLSPSEVVDGDESQVLLPTKKFVTPRIIELEYEVNEQMKRTRSLDYSMFALPMPWTVVHPLTENSPLTPLLLENSNNTQFEVVAIFTGVEESISDNVQARYSFMPEDIKMNHKFAPCIERKRGRFEIDVKLFDTTIPVNKEQI
jgi:inward rectifier potassium channel